MLKIRKPAVLMSAPLILVCLALSSTAHTARSDKKDVSPITVDYQILRELAIDGGAELKFQAFIHVFENLPAFEEKLPEALIFLDKAAASGFLEAQYMQGYIKVRGEAVPKNIEEGIVALTKAANAGHSQAAFWLGMTHVELYYLATAESEQDAEFEKADFWLNRTIASQDEDSDMSLSAQTQLGRIYLARSVSDDRGWKILMAASDAGHKPARKTLISLQGILETYRDAGSKEAGTLLDSVKNHIDAIN